VFSVQQTSLSTTQLHHGVAAPCDHAVPSTYVINMIICLSAKEIKMVRACIKNDDNDWEWEHMGRPNDGMDGQTDRCPTAS